MVTFNINVQNIENFETTFCTFIKYIFYVSDLLISQDSSNANLANYLVNTSHGLEQELVTNNPALQRFYEKQYNVCIVPQVPEDLDLSFENFNLENIEFFTGEGYEAEEENVCVGSRSPKDVDITTENFNLENTQLLNGEEYLTNEDVIHMDTERDENLPTEDDIGNLRFELESTVAADDIENDQNEETEAIISSDVQEVQSSNNNDNSNNSDNSKRQLLVNGFSDGDDTEVMDVGNGEENNTLQESPS